MPKLSVCWLANDTALRFTYWTFCRARWRYWRRWRRSWSERRVSVDLVVWCEGSCALAWTRGSSRPSLRTCPVSTESEPTTSSSLATTSRGLTNLSTPPLTATEYRCKSKVLPQSRASWAHRAALISVSLAVRGTTAHDYGASLSRGMPVYSPAFVGTRYNWPWKDGTLIELATWR